MTTSPAPTVVLVHGAFADASGFGGVIRGLQTTGQQPFSPSPLASTSYPTAFDAPGAPHEPDLSINRERFRATFCADAPLDTAEAMCATQRPLSPAA